MYLSDSELQLLAEKMLKLISPGGFVFVRESCYYPCGIFEETVNPTKYRSPLHYLTVFDSVFQESGVDGKQDYGFQPIFARSIETYIEVCV